MSDPAEQQATLADFLTEMLLLGVHAKPLPSQPPLRSDVEQALEQLAASMSETYQDSKS